jgi:O-antigen/teichoic acid export membrane protein
MPFNSSKDMYLIKTALWLIGMNIEDVIRLSRFKFGKDFFMVNTSNVLNLFLIFILSVIIARKLGPADYGIFVAAFSVMTLVSQLSNFSVAGLVRHYALYSEKGEKNLTDLILKVAFEMKLIASILFLIVGLIVAEEMALVIFKKESLITPLKLAFIGSFGASMLIFVLATLQAREAFKAYSFVNILTNASKFLFIGLLFYAQKINLFNAFTVYVTVPFIGLLVGSAFIPKDFLKSRGNRKEIALKLFHFSKWIMIARYSAVFLNEAIILILTYYLISEKVAYFSIAFRLIGHMQIFVMSLTTVLIPRLSKMTDKGIMIAFAKKSFYYTVPIAIVSSSLFFLAKPFILTLYGMEYADSVLVFQIMLPLFLFSLITAPINLLAYALDKP